MNYSIIIYIIGMILEIEAVFMALPAITALIYQETSGVAFLITIALCMVIGMELFTDLYGVFAVPTNGRIHQKNRNCFI